MDRTNESIYRELANRVVARKNCIESNNKVWEPKHWDKTIELMGLLPHGSGLDSEWIIDWDKSGKDKLVLLQSFHAMDECGMYDGWIPLRITVRASLLFGIELTITGPFGKRQDIKEYLYQILS